MSGTSRRSLQFFLKTLLSQFLRKNFWLKSAILGGALLFFHKKIRVRKDHLARHRVELELRQGRFLKEHSFLMSIDTENATKARVFPVLWLPGKRSTGPKSEKTRFSKTVFSKKKKNRERLQQKFKRNLWCLFSVIKIQRREMAFLGRKRHFSSHRGKRPSLGRTEPYTKVSGRVASREIARTKSLAP
jgi:hypothetical protein